VTRAPGPRGPFTYLPPVGPASCPFHGRAAREEPGQPGRVFIASRGSPPVATRQQAMPMPNFMYKLQLSAGKSHGRSRDSRRGAVPSTLEKRLGAASPCASRKKCPGFQRTASHFPRTLRQPSRKGALGWGRVREHWSRRVPGRGSVRAEKLTSVSRSGFESLHFPPKSTLSPFLLPEIHPAAPSEEGPQTLSLPDVRSPVALSFVGTELVVDGLRGAVRGRGGGFRGRGGRGGRRRGGGHSPGWHPGGGDGSATS